MPPAQTEQQRQATFQAAGQQPAAQAQTISQQPPAQQQSPAATSTAPIQSSISLPPIQSPTPATSLNPSPTINLPAPTAPAVQSSYFGSVANNVQSTQAALQSMYDKQSTDTQSQLDSLKAQQKQITDAENPENSPTYQQNQQLLQTQISAAQASSQTLTTNFTANQNLANELNSIVNEANTQLSNNSNRFASTATLQANQSSTISALTARAGLIQAAMSAYNGQIGQAQTMIDKATTAINAENADNLNYYNTLLTLNRNDQLTLTDAQKTNIANQVSTLQQQAQNAQTTADSIKQAMLDPSTAQAYAQSGVTLTDTPDQINTKLGNYAYSQELSQTNNQMAQQGFNAVLPGQKAPAGAQVVTTTDSKGNQKQYYKLPAANTSDIGSILGTMDTSGVGDVSGNSGNDILSATGLSLPVFNYLTQGTSALSRMSATDRAAVMSNATQWAQQNDVDVSTMQSQYKAYNDVLQKNIERANNTSIFASEVSGTVDQFVTDTVGDFGSLKAGNVAQLFATGQANDPTTQKYAFDLQTMQNDLAGYYAASRGATSPDDSDLRSAANVITNGLNSGGATAFKESIQANEKKVNNVVNGAVDSARQQVWSLFGVGDKFQSAAPQTNQPSDNQIASETAGLQFANSSGGNASGGFLSTVGGALAGMFGF